MGEAAAVDAGARAGGAGHRGEGDHQGAGEGHRAHRQDDRQVLRRQGEPLSQMQWSQQWS